MMKLIADIIEQHKIKENASLIYAQEYVQMILPASSIFGGYLSDVYGHYKIILIFFLLQNVCSFVLTMATTGRMYLPLVSTSVVLLIFHNLFFYLQHGGIHAFIADQIPFPEKYKTYRVCLFAYLYVAKLFVLIYNFATFSLYHGTSILKMSTFLCGYSFITSILLIVTRRYLRIFPSTSKHMLPTMVAAIIYAKQYTKTQGKSQQKWLENAIPKYPKALVQAIRRWTAIYVIIPFMFVSEFVHKTLFTFRDSSKYMNTKLGKYYITTDMLDRFPPIITMLVLPVCYFGFIPLMERHRIIKGPLQWIGMSLIIHTMTCLLGGILFTVIENNEPQNPPKGAGRLRIYNTMNCTIDLFCPRVDKHVTLKPFDSKSYELHFKDEMIAPFRYSYACPEKKFGEGMFNVKERLVTIYYPDENNEFNSYVEGQKKDEFYKPIVRTIILSTNNISVQLSCNLFKHIYKNDLGRYSVYDSPCLILVNSIPLVTYQFKQGGLYTFTVREINGLYHWHVHVVGPPNSVSVAYLIPLYFIYHVGRLLRRIYLQLFLYQEAPMEFKATGSSFYIATLFIGKVVLQVMDVFHRAQFASEKLFLFGRVTIVTFFSFLLCNICFKYADTSEDAESEIVLVT